MSCPGNHASSRSPPFQPIGIFDRPLRNVSLHTSTRHLFYRPRTSLSLKGFSGLGANENRISLACGAALGCPIGAAGHRSPLHIRPFRSTRLSASRPFATAGGPCAVWEGRPLPNGPEASTYPSHPLADRPRQPAHGFPDASLQRPHPPHTHIPDTAVVRFSRLRSECSCASVWMVSEIHLATFPVEHPGQGQPGGYAVISLRCNPPSQAPQQACQQLWARHSLYRVASCLADLFLLICLHGGFEKWYVCMKYCVLGSPVKAALDTYTVS